MGMAKLDDGKVVRIRLLHKWGMTCADLSRKFGVTNGTMSSVLNRKTWRHVA
jgi:lambda repressor-like predicted transcriptional regulator